MFRSTRDEVLEYKPAVCTFGNAIAFYKDFAWPYRPGFRQAVQSVTGQRTEELANWSQFYVVPGVAYCVSNSFRPETYPEDNMQIMVDWVENGVEPSCLNATLWSGANEGETQMLCRWPRRPLWSGNRNAFDCVLDQASYESRTYEIQAFKLPVY